jgi:hypothetical protein
MLRVQLKVSPTGTGGLGGADPIRFTIDPARAAAAAAADFAVRSGHFAVARRQLAEGGCADVAGRARRVAATKKAAEWRGFPWPGGLARPRSRARCG